MELNPDIRQKGYKKNKTYYEVYDCNQSKLEARYFSNFKEAWKARKTFGTYWGISKYRNSNLLETWHRSKIPQPTNSSA